MRLIDRISLERTIRMLLDFILAIIKMFAPSKEGDKPKKPRWRLRKND